MDEHHRANDEQFEKAIRIAATCRVWQCAFRYSGRVHREGRDSVPKQEQEGVISPPQLLLG